MPIIVPETADTQLTRDEDRFSIQSRSTEGLGRYMLPAPMTGANFFMWRAPQVQDAIFKYNFLYPNLRDWQLKYLSMQDTMMASGIYSMKTRMMNLDYQLNGPDAAKNFAQELLNSPGLGDNLSVIVGKVFDDLATCDNGAFLERWGPGDPMTPLDRRAVLGFGHLDSRQCYRTFDPEYPVVYTNPQTSTMHKLHASRVVMMSDNPQPMELARNVGFCSMSRALRWVQYIRDVVIFRQEKISGKFTRALGAVKGVTRDAFEEAMQSRDRTDAGRGFMVYSGIPFLIAPGLRAGEDIDIILKDLASLPEGFAFKDDLTLYAYILAFVFGTDARDFWPATSTGATKADAETQNQKAQSRGIGAITQTIEWGLNQCLPEDATLTYDITDVEFEKQQWEVKEKKVNTWAVIKREGGITDLELRALAIADDIVDRDVLENLDLPLVMGEMPRSGQDDENALEDSGEDDGAPSDEDEEEGMAMVLQPIPIHPVFKTVAEARQHFSTNGHRRELLDVTG